MDHVQRRASSAPQIITFDLSPALAAQVALDRLAERLLLNGTGGSVTYIHKEDRITIQCSVSTGNELAEHLRRVTFETAVDRDSAMASNAVLRKLNVALDAAIGQVEQGRRR